jgi:hypothetical protein
MVIEGGHFIHLGHCHLHFGGERDEMRRGEAAEMILNQMQELDQEIWAPRRVAQQRDHLLSRSSINPAPFWRRAHA